jgi:hypothetical protein
LDKKKNEIIEKITVPPKTTAKPPVKLPPPPTKIPIPPHPPKKKKEV